MPSKTLKLAEPGAVFSDFDSCLVGQHFLIGAGFDVFTDPGPDIKTEGLYDWSGRTVHWFDTEHERRQVLNPGFGTYVMPLPNRIVIAKTRVVHHVERIDQAAGDHFRLSMTGFFE